MFDPSRVHHLTRSTVQRTGSTSISHRSAAHPISQLAKLTEHQLLGGGPRRLLIFNPVLLSQRELTISRHVYSRICFHAAINRKKSHTLAGEFIYNPATSRTFATK